MYRFVFVLLISLLMGCAHVIEIRQTCINCTINEDKYAGEIVGVDTVYNDSGGGIKRIHIKMRARKAKKKRIW